MTTREAVETLAARARKTASGMYLVAALAVGATAVLLTGAAVVVQWAMMDVASLKLAAGCGTLGAFAVMVPTSRYVIRRVIAQRRPTWIDELARTEGLNAKELESYFTMDSW